MLYLIRFARTPSRPFAIPKQDPPLVNDDVDAALFFADLFALLDRAVSRRDYESPELTDAVTRGARAARRAGVPPQRLLAYLRSRTRDAPLAEIGDWYRGVLADRFVARAIEAYFDEPGHPGVPPRLDG